MCARSKRSGHGSEKKKRRLGGWRVGAPRHPRGSRAKRQNKWAGERERGEWFPLRECVCLSFFLSLTVGWVVTRRGGWRESKLMCVRREVRVESRGRGGVRRALPALCGHAHAREGVRGEPPWPKQKRVCDGMEKKGFSFRTHTLSTLSLSPLSPHVVRNSRASPFKNMAISAPPSLDAPYTRSTKTMGTSAHSAPPRAARTATSIWNA